MTTTNFVTTKEIVSIDRIVPNRWNPNYMTPDVFAKAKKSVEELGFMGSILVRRINHTSADYEIMDGEHRWKVLKETNATECPVEIIDRDVSDKEAQMLTILLNNLHGKDDIYKRAKILEALDDGQLQLLPFTSEEIENEKKFVQFDFSQYEGDGSNMPERKFAQVVVLQMNNDEAAIWNKAKSSLQERGIISNDKTKKIADLQMAMFLIKNYLIIKENKSFEGDTITIEK